MKAISQNQSDAQWSSSLLSDLSFIKKHLRYPVSRRTLPLAVVGVLLFFILSRLVLPLVFVGRHAPAYVMWAILPFVVGSALAAFYQYYRTLKFISIPTPFPPAENMRQVESFLRWQHLAVYRHPDAPEVMQIASRHFGHAATGRREIMIFMSDDKRVLVNSHYVNQGLSIGGPSRNARLMARKLREWVEKGAPDDGGGYAGRERQVRG